MSMNFTRRDFLKCAGITVLAVGAGSLLAGCGGGGSGSGAAGINNPLTINGITMKVTGCKVEEVSGKILGIGVTDDNHKFLFPQVTLTNGNANGWPITSATNFTLKVDGETIKYASAVASFAAGYYGYTLLDEDTAYMLPAGKTRSGVLAYIVPTDWKTAELRYTPDLTKTNEFITFKVTNTKK